MARKYKIPPLYEFRAVLTTKPRVNRLKDGRYLVTAAACTNRPTAKIIAVAKGEKLRRKD